MARNVDVRPNSPQSAGWDMVTGARASHTPSMGGGCTPTALLFYPNSVVGAASPGAVLGTGMNTDRYTPGIEAV